MSVALRLILFTAVLAVALVAGLGLGRAVGPVLDEPPPQRTSETHR